MSATIKPEIFASWIPTGKIIFEPLIFATYIPAPVHEKIPADTLRKISKEESTGVDTLRKVGQSEKFSTDTKRALLKTEKSIADTSRKIGITIIRADLKRNVKSRITNSFDTCRKIGVNEIFKADTKRAVGLREKNSADIFLQIVATEKFIADTLRGLREIIRVDTSRKITRTEKFSASTVIRIPHILKYVVKPGAATLKKGLLRDTGTSLINTFKDYGVTAINISLNEKTLSDEFTFDITQPMEINETVQGYLLDYPFHFLVEEITEKDAIRSVKGRYNVDEQLYTWFQMPYGDDSDDDTEDYYPTATEAIREVAGDLGLSANIHIEDFTPTNLRKGDMVTYADVLNSVFGWTSRLPQRQINIFIRGGVLHCIQRGMEEATFDITNLPHSRPTINKKFNRVLCNNPNKSDSDDDDDNKIRFSGIVTYAKEGVAPFDSRFFVGLTYYDGLLMEEAITMQTGMFESEGEILIRSQHTRTEYEYTTKDEQYYTSSKNVYSRASEQNMNTLEVTTTITEENTTYNYETINTEEALYLFHEVTSSRITEPIGEDTVITRETRDIYHFPAGNGFYAQAVYHNGILQGANISQGAPSNRVSPYTIDQIQSGFSEVIETETNNEFDDQLQAIVDDSFPVQGEAMKKKLNEDLRWLHHKIIETVTVDLISKVVDGVPEINHIVDFTDKIKLDGGDYYLVSNRISFTPRKLIQNLQLIRWV